MSVDCRRFRVPVLILVYFLALCSNIRADIPDLDQAQPLPFNGRLLEMGTPYGVAIADFNQDGHVDIASTGFNLPEFTVNRLFEF